MELPSAVHDHAPVDKGIQFRWEYVYLNHGYFPLRLF